MTQFNNTGTSYWDKPPKIKYSFKLEDILKKLDAKGDYIAFELLWLVSKECTTPNTLNISLVDVSKSDHSFDVTIENTEKKYKKAKVETMRITDFCKSYFGNHLKSGEIDDFSKLYNSMKGVSRTEEELDGKLIEVPPFRFDPRNVRNTFISLTTKTYPNPHEEELLPFLPPDLKKDIVGNYYKIIGSGKPESMFCAHLDTADRIQKDVALLNVLEKDPEGKYKPEEYILTDGSSILGADDKAGVTILLYMISREVPGLYYFFMNEERGGVGSRTLATHFWDVDYLANVKRCVAFDRRDYHSVITRQGGTTCCSDAFGNALCQKLNAHGLNMMLDPTGSFTDSKSFVDDIPECTNISVGYMHEHSTNEYQNITYLEILCDAASKIDWDSLPTERRAGLDPDILRRWGPLIREIRKTKFYCDVKFDSSYQGSFLKCDLEYVTVDSMYQTTSTLLGLLNKHKINPMVVFDDTCIKIELK
jgi:hypothetical protein